MSTITEPAEESKEVPTDPYIKLRVVSQIDQEIHFRVKMNTLLRKLIISYADRISTPAGTLRFLFDGRRLNGSETPQDLAMEDNDTIEVYTEQTGGSLLNEDNN